MALLTTILSFGAGYALGTRRDLLRGQLGEQVRSVTQKYVGSSRGGSNARRVRDVMTAVPETLGPEATLVHAATMMADGDIGDALVVDPSDGALVGIVTDRDIIIRAVAAERDPRTTAVRSVLSGDLETVDPDQTVADAASAMRAANVRRLPVVVDGLPVGVVSLADLAHEIDTTPTLANIAVAPPDR